MHNETMKLTGRQKSIKDRLNKNLSYQVKRLQHESAINPDNSLTVQSDREAAQTLTAILEAAFIHGLKSSYYEKGKHSGELPKPQFWNLICKISHKDTIAQTRNMTYIKSNVGKCRAWLRLTLNESALVSYLSALLQTSEYKCLLSRYYEAYSLFRDNEQSDMFLRILQGAESFIFDLSCNSFVLNSWTKTPLELGGVLAPNVIKRNPLLNNHRLNSSALSIKHSSSLNQLRSGAPPSLPPSSLTQSVQIPLSTSPALSVASLRSSSLSYIQVLAGTEVQDGNLVEVLPDAGQASPPSNHHEDGADNVVLHRRHLMRRRSNRHKRKQIDDSASCSTCSRSSSISSIISTESGLTMNRVEGSITRTNRSHSITSSNAESPPVQTIIERKNSVSPAKIFKSHTPDENRAPTVNTNNSSSHAIVQAATEGQKNSNDRLGLACQYKDPPAKDGQKSHKFPSEHNKGSSTPIKVATNIPTTSSSTTQNAHTVNESSLNPAFEEEIVDIYALPPSPPLSSSPDLNVIEETLFESAGGATSAGLGNSLLGAEGWSSDQLGSDVTTEGQSSNQLTNNQTENVNPLDGPKQVFTVIHREGYLQKKRETLMFWRTRWFILSDGTLSYYKDRKCEEKLGFIHLGDVESVDEEEIVKNKSICLKMLDGSEHQIAADSKSLIAAWSKDIKILVEHYKVSVNFPGSLGSLENSYEVLEEYDVEKDGPFRTTESDNTSFVKTMKEHILQIANEKGLDAQNYQCADCACPIGMVYGTPRLCSFTGQYYCPQCHVNDELLVPSRMIHNWDFSKHKVSKRSRKFLEVTWRDPCIDMDRVNPSSYRFLDEMKQLLPLRQRLSSLQPYIITCRIIPIGQFNSKLIGHYYMLEHPHKYSAYDLYQVHSGQLYDQLCKAIDFGIDHVRTCELCSVKGFVCEICKTDEVIFPFESDKISQCEECKGVYHKGCLKDLSKCPKCQRRNKRLKRQAESVEEEAAS